MNSRRRFMHQSLLFCGLLSMPLHAQIYAKNVRILREPYQTMALVYNDLFSASDTMPGIHKLNTMAYLRGVIQDDRISQERKTFLFNGAKWLDEESFETYAKKYHSLQPDQRSSLLKDISKVNWGDSWLYVLMEYFFESMFCDPVYGANLDQSGWKWLDYEPGHPRPAGVSL